MGILHRGSKEGLHGPERLEWMVNELIPILDLVKDHFRILVGAPQTAGRVDGVLELRPVDAGQLHPIAEPHAMPRSHDHVVTTLNVLDALREDIEHARRDGGIDSTEPGAITVSHDQVITDLEILGENVEHAHRHAGIDMKQRQRTASALTKA